MKLPTAVKDRNKKDCDSSSHLRRLLCRSLVLTGGAFTVTLASGGLHPGA